MNTKYLTLLNYDLDIPALLVEAEIARAKSAPYTDTRYPDTSFNHWRMQKHTAPIIESIMDDFEVIGSPRFYFQQPHSCISDHIDNGTLISINFILSENAAPITFNNTNFYYKQCLLNTQLMHRVNTADQERIPLKISIFNETYEDLATRIKYKL